MAMWCAKFQGASDAAMVGVGPRPRELPAGARSSAWRGLPRQLPVRRSLSWHRSELFRDRRRVKSNIELRRGLISKILVEYSRIFRSMPKAGCTLEI